MRIAPSPVGQSLAELEWAKAEAVADEDFIRAGEIKRLIDDRKRDIDRLEADKARAVATEDYGRAEEIKCRIVLLRDGAAAAAARPGASQSTDTAASEPAAPARSAAGGGVTCCGVPCCATCCGPASCCGAACCAGWNGGRDIGQQRKKKPGRVTAKREAGDLRDLKPAPVELRAMGKSGALVPGAVLRPGEALVLPTQGKHVVTRVFLGIGWRAKAGDATPIDIDCCVAPFAQGARCDPDTVWYGRLVSSERPNASVRHTGDVRCGAASGDEDLERIYIDLGQLPSKFDCVGLEASVFNRPSFGHVGSAYVRLVNADTNQELLRCALGADDLGHQEKTGVSSVQRPQGADGDGGSIAGARHVLLAKLFRGKDRWTVHACVEPRAKSVRGTTGASPDAAFVVPPGLDGPPPEPPAPLDAPSGQAMDRGSDVDGPHTQKKPAKKTATFPRENYLVPALAVATVAGVAAAVAIFAASKGLTSSDLASGLFEDGVDFGHLVSGVDPRGCCADGCGACCDACKSLPCSDLRCKLDCGACGLPGGSACDCGTPGDGCEWCGAQWLDAGKALGDLGGGLATGCGDLAADAAAGCGQGCGAAGACDVVKSLGQGCCACLQADSCDRAVAAAACEVLPAMCGAGVRASCKCCEISVNLLGALFDCLGA